ncbi:MAG: FecR family protein [Azonexus sp.]|nr:FecR family protein [Azonexus sp.]
MKTFSWASAVLVMALCSQGGMNAYAAQEAATLLHASGSVTLVSAEGKTRPAAKGAALMSGETVTTGQGGLAQLRFSDGGMVSLQENSNYRIDQYAYTGSENGEERGFFSLVKGGMRTITGSIGHRNKENYRVTTRVAVIGIRGTEYTLRYLDDDALVITTQEGAVQVCVGENCVVLSSGDTLVLRSDAGNRHFEFQSRIEGEDHPGLVETFAEGFSLIEQRDADGSLILGGGALRNPVDTANPETAMANF